MMTISKAMREMIAFLEEKVMISYRAVQEMTRLMVMKVTMRFKAMMVLTPSRTTRAKTVLMTRITLNHL